jgi:hypothetical protein
MVVVCIIFGVLIAVCVVTIAALLRAKDGFEDSAGIHEVAYPPSPKAAVVGRQIKINAPSREHVAAAFEMAAE